ncbi:hypothetical protein OKW38_002761 [Paraburkholderia sp. MM5496-R1]|uniref:hypothetical protein n=1 Tax=unclassified Paraburkholderia TaxID=2615204 RepID=UPI003D24E319
MLMLLLAAAESTKRNEGMRELNRVQVDKSTRSLLQLAVERLRTVLKTVDYKYDACRVTTFQTFLARWVEHIPVANQPTYKQTLQLMAGGENLSARTYETGHWEPVATSLADLRERRPDTEWPQPLSRLVRPSHLRCSIFDEETGQSTNPGAKKCSAYFRVQRHC